MPDPSEPPSSPAPPAALLAVRRVVATAPVTFALLAGSLALLAQVGGYLLGWAGHQTAALVVFHLSLAALVVPFTALLLAAGLSGRQRLLGAVAYTQLLYLSWLLTSPLLATRFDETLHVTTLLSITEGDGLFTDNAMLPVSPHYPGLELVAAGLHWTTGLPLMLCQVLTAVLARTVLVVALFWVGSRIGRSTRVGGVFVLLYSASAQFYFFNAQFSYQTVAIAMLAAGLALLLQASDTTGRRTVLLMTASQVCFAALAITHHLTSWLTLGALWLLALLFRLGAEKRRARLTLVAAEVATAIAAAWTTLIAPLLARYLGPIFDTAGTELSALLTGESAGQREVLGGTGGTPTPLWEVSVMFTGILIWCLLLVPAGWGALRGTTMSRTTSRLLLLGLAVLYPILFVARFFPTAAEVSDRASTFVTMALGLLVALWAVPRLARLRSVAVPGVLVLVLGGVLLGGGAAYFRVPGPYLPGAEQRSVDGDTVAFARWAGRYLPDGARFASDTTLNRLLPNFGPLEPVTQQGGNDNLTPLFIAPAVDDDVIALLQDSEVDFVVVDRRTIGERAYSATYYEAGDAFGEEASEPTAQMLLKFGSVPEAEVVLDEGPITVYDVRGLRGQPQPFTDRGDPGLPGDWVPWQLAVAAAALALAAVVRRRVLVAALRRTDGRHLWLLAVSVPALMLLGVLSVLVGSAPARGSALLVALVGLLVVLAGGRGTAPGETWPESTNDGGTTPGRLAEGSQEAVRSRSGRLVLDARVLVVLVLAAAVGLACAGHWDALDLQRQLPAPVSTGVTS